MYCRKCGKFIEGEVELCEECAKTEQPEETVETVETATENVVESTVAAAPIGNKKKGMGLGIAGTVIAVVGLLVVSIAYGVYMGALLAIQMGTTNSEILAAAELFVSICPGMIATCWVGAVIAVPAIILGAIAMKTFFSYKKATGVKAIPTLVTGIIALALGVSVLFTGMMFAGVMQSGMEQIAALL